MPLAMAEISAALKVLPGVYVSRVIELIEGGLPRDAKPGAHSSTPISFHSELALEARATSSPPSSR